MTEQRSRDRKPTHAARGTAEVRRLAVARVLEPTRSTADPHLQALLERSALEGLARGGTTEADDVPQHQARGGVEIDRRRAARARAGAGDALLRKPLERGPGVDGELVPLQRLRSRAPVELRRSGGGDEGTAALAHRGVDRQLVAADEP